MSPIASETIHEPQAPAAVPLLPPTTTQARYAKAGLDISSKPTMSSHGSRTQLLTIPLRSDGYPFYPKAPKFVSEVTAIRTDLRDYVDPATRADPEKKALFGAAKSVKNLTVHIGVSHFSLSSCSPWLASAFPAAVLRDIFWGVGR